MPWTPMGYLGGLCPPNIASIMLIYIYKCYSEASSLANGHSSEVECSLLKPAIWDRFSDTVLEIVETLSKLGNILF